MCGRVVVDYDEMMPVAADSELAAWMTAAPEGAESSWNLKPTEQIPVVLTSTKDGSRRFELSHWGIIPPWSKDGTARNTFNARSEEVFDKPTFAPQMKAQRCVVPVSAFYEWTGPKGRRIPNAIFGPRPMLRMAGLYRWWRAPDGEWRLTSTIFTREATGVMAELHHRMPVFMSGDLVADWLDPLTVGDEHLLAAVCEASIPLSEQLTYRQVQPLRGDSPELLQPAER